MAQSLATEAVGRQRLAAASKLLDQLVSYNVRDGRLDASGAIPGVIVRRQWRVDNPAKPSLLERSGAAYRAGADKRAKNYRFRFGSTKADLRLEYLRTIVEDRTTGHWLALAQDKERLVYDD